MDEKAKAQFEIRRKEFQQAIVEGNKIVEERYQKLLETCQCEHCQQRRGESGKD